MVGVGNGMSPHLVPANNRMVENTAALPNAASDKVRKRHRSECMFCFPTSFDTHFYFFSLCFFIFGTNLQCEVSSRHVHPSPLWLQTILIPSIDSLAHSGTSLLLLCFNPLKCFKILRTSHHNNINNSDTSSHHICS